MRFCYFFLLFYPHICVLWRRCVFFVKKPHICTIYAFYGLFLHIFMPFLTNFIPIYAFFIQICIIFYPFLTCPGKCAFFAQFPLYMLFWSIFCIISAHKCTYICVFDQIIDRFMHFYLAMGEVRGEMQVCTFWTHFSLYMLFWLENWSFLMLFVQIFSPYMRFDDYFQIVFCIFLSRRWPPISSLYAFYPDILHVFWHFLDL